MGALVIIGGIVWLLYNLIKEACEPTQTRPFDYEAYNKDVSSHNYSSKQIAKKLEHGEWRK